MSGEQPINNLPPEEEPVAPPPAEEPGGTAPVEELPEDDSDLTPVIDEAPDPAKLKAEIDELEAARQKAKEDAIYWRKQKAEARADYFKNRGREEGAQPSVQPEMTADEPKPSDFEDYDQYVAALVDHRTAKAREQWETEAARKAESQEKQRRHENLQAKLQEGFEKYEDFEEVAFDRTASHITPMIVDILTDCEHPADLAYYLAKNRTEGIAISRMTPVRAAREIAKLEVKLAESAPAPASRKKPITGAPEPIKPVVSGNAGLQKDPEKMTQKEYNEWRLSQGARKY